MSTLVTTNIQTANGTTDLTIKTGNTSSAAIILAANGSGFVIQGNSTSNVMTVNSTAVSYLGTQSLNAVSINLSTNTFTIGTAAYHVSNGYFGIGTNTPPSLLTVYSNTTSANLSLIGDNQTSSLNVYRFSNNSSSPQIYQYKARGSNTTPLTVVAGDVVGNWLQYVFDGTSFKQLSQIRSVVDTVGGTDDFSGYLQFYTRTDGPSAAVTERMRIDKNGNTGIGNTSPAHTLRVEGTISALTSVGVGSAVTINTTSTYIANLTSNGTSYVSNGFYVVAGNWGVVSANITLNAANGNYQYLTSNAAYTITAPTQDCAIDILILNGSSAGSLTFSGFTIQSGGTGDTYATTASSQFILSVRRINGVSTYVWKALQ
jgi:hypothetical protein